MYKSKSKENSSRYHSEVVDKKNFVAFLPNRVRKAISRGEIKRSTQVKYSTGVCLFVDVSGFTQLGKVYSKTYDPKEATERLAKEIMNVLECLTNICLEWGGDVSKFAGDALICIWHGKDVETLASRVELVAQDMLISVKEINPDLDIHGGIGYGSIFDFFLYGKGSRKNFTFMGTSLGSRPRTKNVPRWYLASGFAPVLANFLAGEAPRGTIFSATSQNFSTEGCRRITRRVFFESRNDELQHIPRDRKSSDLYALRDSVFPCSLPESFGNIAEELNNSTLEEFVPPLVRKKLAGGGFKGGQIMPNVCVMFICLDYFQLTEIELKQNKVDKKKLKDINTVFGLMLHEVRTKKGEVRDMLYDDKGCVFIALFNAHNSVEHPERLAMACAHSIIRTAPKAKIGINCGECFVGMCGMDQRHDFVAISHEVNLASRYSNNAEEGQILVGESVYQKLKKVESFQPHSISYMKKSPDENGENIIKTEVNYDCYLSTGRIKREISFLAHNGTFILSDDLDDGQNSNCEEGGSTSIATAISTEFIVGRRKEISGIISSINQTKLPSVSRIEGLKGSGKSHLIKHIREKVRNKADVVYCACLDFEQGTSLFLYKQLVFTLLGLNSADPESITPTEFDQACQRNQLVVPEEVAEHLLVLKKAPLVSMSEPTRSNKYLGSLNRKAAQHRTIKMSDIINKPQPNSGSRYGITKTASPRKKKSEFRLSTFTQKTKSKPMRLGANGAPTMLGKLANSTTDSSFISTGTVRPETIMKTQSVGSLNSDVDEDHEVSFQSFLKFLCELLKSCLRESKLYTLVIVLEDFQWIDLNSFEIFQYLPGELMERVHLIISHRPEKHLTVHERNKIQILDKKLDQLNEELIPNNKYVLGSLSSRRVAQLVFRLLMKDFNLELDEQGVKGEKMLDTKLRQLIELRGGGLPSRIILLTKFFNDKNYIKFDPDKHNFRLKEKYIGKAFKDVPESLINYAKFRLNKLDGEHIWILKVAVCLAEGRKFDEKFLYKVLKKDSGLLEFDHFRDALLYLQHLDFIASDEEAAKNSRVSFSRLDRYLPTKYKFKELYAEALLEMIPERRKTEIEAFKEEVRGAKTTHRRNAERRKTQFSLMGSLGKNSLRSRRI
eukprot:snap_masked-scaffold_86-processed-gene-0.0-mRNA-1 protein AED:1.00 eAED:1.00 QI:0/-1/0/0/-1/1/1/0/1122